MTSMGWELRRKYHSYVFRQRGLSLVELMISLTIGLILLAGITSLIVKQSTTRTEMEKSSRQIENGRYAIELLKDDIEHAGLYGDYSPPANSSSNFSTRYTAPVDPCDVTGGNLGWTSSATTATVPVELPAAVVGYSVVPGSCGSLMPYYKNGTGVLVVRRTSTAPVSNGWFQASRCNNDGFVFKLNDMASNLQKKSCLPTDPADRYSYIQRIYFVSQCNPNNSTAITCPSSDPQGVPILKVIEINDGVLPSAATALVEGIENVQFDFGFDNTNDGAPDVYLSGGAIAASGLAQTLPYDSLPALGLSKPIPTPGGSIPLPGNTSSKWGDVMSVRVNLLARNTESTAGFVDTKKYQLSGVSGASLILPDSGYENYKRHAYAEVVRLVNPSGRRELP